MTTEHQAPPAAPESPVDERVELVAGVDERPHRRREWAGGLRSVVLPLLVVGTIVAAIWYLQRGDGGTAPAQGTGIVSLPADRNLTGKPAAVQEGRAAPDFVLNTLDGGAVRLSDLRGKIVVMNFWATWCGPCRQEMPEMVKVYQEQTGGVVVLAIDSQEADGPVREFVEGFGVTFPVPMDRSGAVGSAYGVKEFPTSLFIDKTGVIRTIKRGPMNGTYLREQLAALS